MSKSIKLAAVALVLTVTVSAAQAQSRCPAATSGCQTVGDIKTYVDERAKEFMSERSTYENGWRGVRGRAHDFKDFVRDCATCMKDAAGSGFGVFGSGGSGRR